MSAIASRPKPDPSSPYGLEPDVVYSTDARGFFADMPDPYLKQGHTSVVPAICGGLFYVKSNARTRNLYREVCHTHSATPISFCAAVEQWHERPARN